MDLHNTNHINSLKEGLNPLIRLRKLPVWHKNVTLILDLDNIVYFESADMHCLIFMKGQQNALAANYHINFLEALFMNDVFFRINRAYLINLNYMIDFTVAKQGTAHLNFNGAVKNLAISRNYMPALKRIARLD